MDAVTVKKSELLEKIRANREGHRKIFLEAVEGYRTQMVNLLNARVKDVKAGKLLRQAVVLPVPEDHTHEYDRVILMLEMHQGDTVEIEESQFAAYVMDDWSWKRQFLSSNASYSGTAAASL